jgi:hypothetical protein
LTFQVVKFLPSPQEAEAQNQPIFTFQEQLVSEILFGSRTTLISFLIQRMSGGLSLAMSTKQRFVISPTPALFFPSDEGLCYKGKLMSIRLLGSRQIPVEGSAMAGMWFVSQRFMCWSVDLRVAMLRGGA